MLPKEITDLGITENAKLKAAFTGEVIKVLYSPEVRSIKFTLFGMSIDGSDFASIANNIIFGFFLRKYFPINCCQSFIEIAAVSGMNNASGGYASKYNILAMRSNEYLKSRMFGVITVHESVHAWADMKRLSTKLYYEIESMAYIAEHIYGRKVGLPWSRHSKKTMYYLARKTANQIIAKNLKDAEKTANELLASLRKSPYYGSGSRAKDGNFDG